MINERDLSYQQAPTEPGDPIQLQRELDEAMRTIRTLQRQIGKEQARYNVLAQSYTKTVANLEASNRENFELERDRDMWKARAEGTTLPNNTLNIPLDLTPTEVSAIRKTMARLHHPDIGGDQERMQMWNAALDALEG